MKKCIEMRKILFKNWKWLFENTNQTPRKSLNHAMYWKFKNNMYDIDFINKKKMELKNL